MTKRYTSLKTGAVVAGAMAGLFAANTAPCCITIGSILRESGMIKHRGPEMDADHITA